MHHDLTISPSGGGGGRGDTPPSARSGTGKNYTRKKTAGKRLDPLPNGNKGRKTLEKGDLEEVLRKINQTPLPSQVVGKVIPPAPEIIDATATELENLRNNVAASAKKFNDLKLLAEEKAREKARLTDTFFDVKRETASLSKMSNNETWGTKRINELEADIQKIDGEIGECLDYRQHIAFMHKRQVKNQKTMEKYLKDLEANCKKSNEEREYLTQLMRELEAAKNKLVVEIQNKKIEFELKVRDRAKSLTNREMEAINAARMEKWRLDRGKLRKEIEAEAAGDLTKEEELRLEAELQKKFDEHTIVKSELEMHNSHLATLESAFQRIRQSTGVSTLDEMVEKFLGQESSKANLEEERGRTEKHLNQLNDERNHSMNDFNLMKAQGMGDSDGLKEKKVLLEKLIYELDNHSHAIKARVTNLDSIMLSLQQGAVGLKEKIETYYNLLEKSDIDELTNHETKNVTVNILNECQAIMIKLTEATSDKNGFGEGEAPGERPGTSTLLETAAEKLNSNNVRVMRKKNEMFLTSVSLPSSMLDESSSCAGGGGSGGGSNSNGDKDINSKGDDEGIITSTSKKTGKDHLKLSMNTEGENDIQLVDRKTIKRDSKKIVTEQSKRNDTMRKAKELGEEAEKNLGTNLNSPQAKKRMQEIATERLLMPVAKEDNVDPMFVTQLPVLL